VSSTWLDLQPERQSVQTALQRLHETKFLGMEYFGSRDESTRHASLDEVDRSLVYIGIIGGRYGSGITEVEYHRARALKLPCFIYFKREHCIEPESRESDPQVRAKLAAFRQELQDHHTIAEFTGPEDLAARVTADLHTWLLKDYLPPRLAEAARGHLPLDESRRLLNAIKDEGGLDAGLLADARQVLITGSGNIIGNQVAGDVVYGQKIVHKSSLPAALVALAMLICALAVYLYVNWARSDGIYRVRAMVTSPQGAPAEEARVWSSIGGEPKKIAGGWQFDIPAAAKPKNGKLQFFATHDNAFLKGQADLTLGDDFNPAITIRLVHDTSAKIRGRVTDDRGRSVAGARVFVEGYGDEAVVTKEDGNFVLPAHKAQNQQVLIVAEKAGLGVARLWHPAGDTPVQLVLLR